VINNVSPRLVLSKHERVASPNLVCLRTQLAAKAICLIVRLKVGPSRPEEIELSWRMMSASFFCNNNFSSMLFTSV
jgi:hypothetical protein